MELNHDYESMVIRKIVYFHSSKFRKHFHTYIFPSIKIVLETRQGECYYTYCMGKKKN